MLTADEARRLERLVLGASAASPLSSAAGLRRARGRGTGIEFLDYRHYQPGDDPRSIDWTVEARLDQLVVRVSRAEGHLALHVLLDVSASMRIGAPSKLACAGRIAAALAYVAIERRDAAGLATLGTRVDARIRPATGRPQLFRILEQLRGLHVEGRASLNEALMAYGAGAKGPGLAVVISDFLEAGQTYDGLRFLMYRGLRPAVIQVLAPEERRPRIAEVVELLDVEDPDATPCVVDDAVVASYMERMTDLTERLRTYCLSHGLPYVLVESTADLNEVVSACQQAGVLAAYA